MVVKCAVCELTMQEKDPAVAGVDSRVLLASPMPGTSLVCFLRVCVEIAKIREHQVVQVMR
jgi:hypothetical protein